MDLVAAEVMNTKVISVRPDLTIPELERRLVDEKVGGFPVVDEGTLCGVVSRSDVLRHLCAERSSAEVATGFYKDGYTIDVPATLSEWVSKSVGVNLDRLRVNDVMARHLIAVSPADSLLDVAKTMKQHKIHRVLVTENRRLVGVITSFDFVRLYADARIQARPGNRESKSSCG